MQRAEQLRLIERLMKHLDAGTNVDAGGQVRNPVSCYTDPEIARQEWTTLFQETPHLLGLSSDLPKPGTFFTSRDLGKPILCTRDQDGVFHAFLNVCRHRGTVVETEARGEKRQFNCPFHAWGYAHDGRLVAVPKEDQFGPVDRECHSLIALPAEEKWGMLWISPDPDATLDVAGTLGELGEEFGSWDLARYQRQADTRFDHSMNWKLAIDTFGETYHFNTLHKNTLAENIYGNVQLYDKFAPHHRMMLCLKNIDALRTYSQEHWNVLHAALPVYFIYPNVQLIIGDAGPTLVRIYPDGDNPNQSHSQISFYLDPSFSIPDGSMREQDRDPRDAMQRMEGFASIIQNEDYVAAASAHVGALSGAQDYVLFGRNEPALHHYHNTYRAALGMPPLEVVSN